MRERHYFFDLDAIREPLANTELPGPGRLRIAAAATERVTTAIAVLPVSAARGCAGHPLGKNPGDVWQIAGARVRGHGASFPAELIRRPILATCPEKVCIGCGKPWQRARHPVRFADGKPRPRALVPCGCGVATRPGLVLDPFMGSGTVALVARQLWAGLARYRAES